ncbi:hypothetical protein JRC04_04810 [Mycolicibacterium sp. S2-37]|uniref:hypothetical protein n=1 Tax=Mycolicibacterium sp. S2-37 TaxID=2810297 RepID=UPI001A9405E2|nr:hypothetical protein [Mycolicibacterium sp. S2-37]MBO0676780.1 hypothetical protein [Mycolicibacterium sp. S2-37]
MPLRTDYTSGDRIGPAEVNGWNANINANTDALKVGNGVARTASGTQQCGIPGTSIYGQGTSALAANEDRYVPIEVRSTVTLTGWQLEVTTGPSGDANLRVGIFKADNDLQPSTSAYYDSGAIPVTAGFTGIKTAGSLAITLQPGTYLVAISSSAVMTLRSLLSPSPTLIAALGANAIAQRFSVSRTFGAFANPGTAWTTVVAGQGGLTHSVAFQWA